MIYNHLAYAKQLIPLQTISYTPFSARTLNNVGLEVNTYGTAQSIKASVQAVQRSMYEDLGLDFQKKYVTIYLESKLVDVDRGTAGDRFTYNGETYQVESNLDWYSVDGWTSLMAAKID